MNDVVNNNVDQKNTHIFNESSINWSPEVAYNMIFLKSQQNYANDILRSRGHVFLNDVYDFLGFKRTSAGAITGWIISKESESFISFGDLIAEPDGSILLHFNVDGIIYDKI